MSQPTDEPRYGQRLTPEQQAAQQSTDAAENAAVNGAQSADAPAAAAPTNAALADPFAPTQNQPAYGQQTPQAQQPANGQPAFGQQAPAQAAPNQGPYGSHGYGAPASTPSGTAAQPSAAGWAWQQEQMQQPRKRRWGVLVTGLVLMIVVPIMLVGAAFFAGARSFGSVASLESTTQISNGEAAFLAANETFAIYPSKRTAVEPVTCQVSDPQGGAVSIFQDSELGVPVFMTTEAGRYTIDCENVTTLTVGPQLSTDTVLAAGALFLAALFFGFIGLIVTIIGAVRFVRS